MNSIPTNTSNTSTITTNTLGIALENDDIILNIFDRCMERDLIDALLALSCTTKHCNAAITAFAARNIDLKTHCPNFTIIDQEEVFKHVSRLALLKCYKEMAPINQSKSIRAFYYNVLTMDELVAWGKKLGIKISVPNLPHAMKRWICKEEDCVSIVTDGVVIGSKEINHVGQGQEIKVREYKCQMLTLRKTIYVFLRTYEISGPESIKLFGIGPKEVTKIDIDKRGEHNWAHELGWCIEIKGSTKTCPSLLLNHYSNTRDGVSCQRKFCSKGL